MLLAVQDELVNLDTPITAYIPDFTVNSRFKYRPEQRITLRHLLNHTAGFTHEAPMGNWKCYVVCVGLSLGALAWDIFENRCLRGSFA